MIIKLLAALGALTGAGIGLALLMVFGILLLAGLAIFLFVFWILMIVDCAQRNFKKENDKIVWILVLIFLQVLGAIIYYFIVKRNRKN